MEIIWKDIPDFPQYQINNIGQVRSFKYSKEGKLLVLTETSATDPRLKVRLNKNNKRYNFSVHRLMMKIFKPVENMDELEVNHIDGNPQNNTLENLEWVTPEENHKHYKEVLIPQRKENGTFAVGRKADILKISFTNGVINYYNGNEDAAAQLNIGAGTISRIKQDPQNNLCGIIKIEVVDEIPLDYKNTPIKITPIIKSVVFEYWKKSIEIYPNCKAADLALGLSIGTTQRWVKRNWTSPNKGKATELGIKKVYYSEI